MNILTFDAVIYFIGRICYKKYDIDMLLVVVIAVSGIVCYAFPDYFDVRAAHTNLERLILVI